MSDAGPSLRPAWQTDELEDEWIDQEPEPEDDSHGTLSLHAHSASDVSFTQPLGSFIVHNRELQTDSSLVSPDAGGTFLVREDVPAAPVLPKTPGRNRNPFGKNFFSPLALERMFEPPSPPADHPAPLPPAGANTAPTVPSRLSQAHVPNQDDTEILEDASEESVDDHGEEAGLDGHGIRAEALDCEFTFEAPLPSPFGPDSVIPAAQSTPGPPHPRSVMMDPPPTDPRLRLFQFNYDTFTRDHLSAMVDSIAVNTPSADSGAATTTSGHTPSTGLSPVPEISTTRLRSAKRIKLSPAGDLKRRKGDGVAAIRRPLRKDYVGESKSLMEKIRRARDFSTISTVASARSPDRPEGGAPPGDSADNSTSPTPLARQPSLAPGEGDGSRVPSSSWTAASSKRGVYSSLGYREQAANLMAQIRNDMKGARRIFSGDTEASHMIAEEGRREEAGSRRMASAVVASSDRRGSVRVREPLSSGGGGTTRPKRKLSPPARDDTADEVTDEDADLADGVTHLSLDTERLLAQFPDPPVRLTVTAEAPSPPPASRPSVPTRHTPEPNPYPPTSASIPVPRPGPNANSALLAPHPAASAYPSSSLRAGRNEDLARFVSSSTASGTTLTAGSAASFVKHPGPKQIMRIAPEDVPVLPERVGKMVFDKVMMKWVKDTAAATVGAPRAGGRRRGDPGEAGEGNDSEDPFRDIESLESLREEDVDRFPGHAQCGVIGEEDEEEATDRFQEAEDVSEVEDEEEAELTSFSFDGPSAEDIPGDDYAGTDETDSQGDEDEDEDETDTTIPMDTLSDESDEEFDAAGAAADTHGPALQDSPPRLLVPPQAHPSISTPNVAARASTRPGSDGTLRSALRSASVTPVSALKDPNRPRDATPAGRLGRRRSVSFSDGKRDGPIRGIGRNVPTPDPDGADGTEDEDDSPLAGGSSKAGSVLVPSARSKRISDMLGHLENDAVFEDDSPSKTSSTGRPPTDELRPLKMRRPSGAGGSPARDVSRRVFSRPHGKTPASAARNAHATFLTECSFAVAHDRLVQVITDVQPFEPYWERLTSIDLSAHSIDSVARLKEFLPRLDSLTLNTNRLAWLSGVPGTLRSLSVASNVLTGLTSFGHLLNLENLDISRNQIDSLRQLECLRHLRELRADGNGIDSIDGLQEMDGLVKLSLHGNDIRELDLGGFRWTRLEMLNVSHNRVCSLAGLESVPALVALNLDYNALDELEPDGAMPRLRILRVTGNRLKQLNAAPFPNLRTLYADNNCLGTIGKAHRLTKLEHLSLRNQSGKPGLSLSLRDVRDVKRLYLSGNPLKDGFIPEPCYNLVYLELAACRLQVLPPALARLVPNVRVLNLNYNFLEDPRPLEGLTRLRKLTLIGSRIKEAKQLVRILRGMTDIEMLDFRMNPCTLGWYLPLLVRDVPGALQPSDGDRPGPGTAGPAGSRGPASQVGANHDHHRSVSKPRGAPPRSHEQSSSSRGAPAPTGTGGAVDAAVHGQGEAPAGGRSHGGDAPASAAWKDLDAKFRRDLPDEAYVGRLAYRGLVMRACPGITLLDGVETSAKEREKAEKLLATLGLARDRVRGPAPAPGDAGGLTREKAHAL